MEPSPEYPASFPNQLDAVLPKLHVVMGVRGGHWEGPEDLYEKGQGGSLSLLGKGFPGAASQVRGGRAPTLR